ncbi:DNA (cytosine-5)-methyltransferase 1-like [Anthonomus grandis grandis]|uniref:DNA (cytosine-5)-methyltransferase 1-like n=1 Tax=Anthonomus grandis grandis TaxID=2921223 RepID=UPI0021662590|nr:DNA (cytosine-5)-methyltransferase 1-like [Anthonomus grandis grandis]
MVEGIFFHDWEKKKNETSKSSNKGKKRKGIGAPIVEWVKCTKSKDNKYFKFARVGETYINQGDSILIPGEEQGQAPQIAYITYMFEDPKNKNKMCHAHFYCRGSDTILGDMSDPRELFLVDHCEDVALSTIIGKAKVYPKELPKNWNLTGGTDKVLIHDSDDGKHYYFSKRYDYNASRFVDFTNEGKSRCISCTWQNEEDKLQEVAIQYYAERMGRSFVRWKNEKYYVGSGVFIDYEREIIPKSRSNTRSTEQVNDNTITLEKLGNDIVQMSPLDRKIIFPERYRNEGDNPDSFEHPCQPYTVGVIEQIRKNHTVVVREFWRVEDTGSKDYGHPHLVYWTSRLYYINNQKKWQAVVKGKCYVSNSQHIGDIGQWIKEGPFRFYFEKGYNPNKDIFFNLPLNAMSIGKQTRKIRRKPHFEEAPIWPELKTKLKSMDIYSGCGGLSDGLERAGLVNTKWAIDINPSAAEAFQLNNPSADVFEDNCNDVLCVLLEGRGSEIGMPEKGEVDIIVGGPPCQGFSIINRFKDSQSAKTNNCQINTYLGFIDYFRPKYFVFENVRNFTTYDKSRYFKLTIKCILEIGYQVTFGILQAGNYGLPQSRRRIFLIGAAPGLVLPKLPDPTHCFGKFEKIVETLKIDNLKYDIGDLAIGQLGSLPYRRVTIRDAIADLPPTTYDTMVSKMPYQTAREDMSFYAKGLREFCNKDDIVTDHEANYASAITKKRIQFIPEGGDWTDLPNISVILENGIRTEVLNYTYRTKIQNPKDPPKGLCACVLDKPCNQEIKKNERNNTLIPWSVAHTASRNNNWKGVYGRVIWDGHFGTVTTNPEPTRAQGRD